MADKSKTVRLRNVNSGAIVSVAAETAALLDSEWEPADKPAPTAKPKPAAKK